MLGSPCETGEDRSQEGKEGFRPGQVKSFIAFDFVREYLVIKATLAMPVQSLPPALRPLDAELCFDDIAAQGIHIADRPILPKHDAQGKIESQFEVTLTVTSRRPPKFHVGFEPDDDTREAHIRGQRVPTKRRATAMDFAISGVVRLL